jgi:calcineurin-like phosphoesterase family protein
MPPTPGEAPVQKYSNGLVVSKAFHDPETSEARHYEGIIQTFQYCTDSKKWMYLIYYPEDDDYEHMTAKEVNKHLKQDYR